MIIEPVWASRNQFLDQFELSNCRVVDFGCGDKSILNYQKFKDYIGLDKNPTADIIIDFNLEKINLTTKYDVGLVLGVLEYLDNPNDFICQIKKFADKFIILVLLKNIPKYHHGWKQAYSENQFKELLDNSFKTVNYYRHNNYLIGECFND